MTEAAKPRMPRRPEKRTPSEPRELNKEEEQRIEQIENDSLLLSLDEQACALLCTEYSPEEAAIKLGWSLHDVHKTLRQPHVRLFLKKAQEEFIKDLSKAKVRRMNRVGISRGAIEQRFWDLANLDPKETRGNIDGQVKALTALAGVMGYSKEQDPLKDKSPEELREIIARGHSKMIEGKTDPSVN